MELTVFSHDPSCYPDGPTGSGTISCKPDLSQCPEDLAISPDGISRTACASLCQAVKSKVHVQQKSQFFKDLSGGNFYDKTNEELICCE